MNSKRSAFYQKAKEMYVKENKTYEEIAKALCLSTKTVSSWKSMEIKSWAEQRRDYLSNPDLTRTINGYIQDLIIDRKRKGIEVSKSDIKNFKDLVMVANALEPKNNPIIVESKKKKTDITMTIKDIAETCKVSKRTVERWCDKLSQSNDKMSQVKSKIEVAKKTSKPAQFNLEETIEIIRAGGNETLANLLYENALKNQREFDNTEDLLSEISKIVGDINGGKYLPEK